MTAEFLRGILVSSGSSRFDITTFAGFAAASVIVSFVGVQLVRPVAACPIPDTTENNRTLSWRFSSEREIARSANLSF